MSYSRRCASGKIGNIYDTARASQDWNATVLNSGELSLEWTARTKPDGHVIFGFTDVENNPDQIVGSVACYGGPSEELLKALKKLIHQSEGR